MRATVANHPFDLVNVVISHSVGRPDDCSLTMISLRRPHRYVRQKSAARYAKLDERIRNVTTLGCLSQVLGAR